MKPLLRAVIVSSLVATGLMRAQLVQFGLSAPITALDGNAPHLFDASVQLGTPLSLTFTYPLDLPLLNPLENSPIYYGSGGGIRATAGAGDMFFELSNVRLELGSPVSITLSDGTTGTGDWLFLYATSSPNALSRFGFSAVLAYPNGTFPNFDPALPPPNFAFGELDLFVNEPGEYQTASAIIHNFRLTGVPESGTVGLFAGLLLAVAVLARTRRRASRLTRHAS